jgi:hypothetical protein
MLTDGSSATALPRDLSSAGVRTAHHGVSKVTDIGARPTPSQETKAPSQQAPKASAATPAPTRQGGVSGPQKIKTLICKGPHGIGLDLAKSATGMAQVQRFKEMPTGVQNPAINCVPSIEFGDIITEVNGAPCASFADLVKAIRALPEGNLTLTLERNKN